ncbi:MAG: ABC transporter permease [Mesorhizobium sp.]|nr:MAG: ABC transporter permease [Mesorhizobium sp.]
MSAVRLITRSRLGFIGLTIVLVFVLVGLFGPWVAPLDPSAINVQARLAPPSWMHPLGTDQLGRDTLSRVLSGTQVAFLVAFLSISLTVVLGVSTGVASGLGPRWLDRLLITIFDTVRSFPMLMFGIAVIALFGPSLWTIITIIVISSFPTYARIARTQTRAIENNEFILAERSIGVGSIRIAVMHILPNILGQILVLASMDVPVVIMVEAGLSFLGLGIRPPNASWGTILNDGYSFIRNSPWPVLAGGVPLILATIGFTFLGEALRDLLDPKLRRATW